MPTGAPEISLGQKYLTTTTSLDPIYMSLDQHRDLKKLTGASPIISTLRGSQGTKNEVPRSLGSRDMASFRFRRPKKAQKGPKSPTTQITVTFDWVEIEPSYFQG